MGRKQNFEVRTIHGEKGRDAVDLGVTEIPDVRERDG